MTLIKSLLLGSAAGIVTVASAQAADLPTHKAAPVQYVQICNVGGITGWTLPGSDTCVKFSGYITAQFTGGNLETQYNWKGTAVQNFFTNQFGVTVPFPSSQRLLIAGTEGPVPVINGLTGTPILRADGTPFILPGQQNSTFWRHATGWTTRANFGFDLASNTAYGPLIGHFDINAENSNGFDNTGGYTYVNTAYVTWAGITAGKAQSFFSFTGGGDNWANLFSPDRKGFNEPNLLAYTASFGGGFSATISAESPGCNGGGDSSLAFPTKCTPGGSGGGTQMTAGTLAFGGFRWPDIVGALHYKGPWGEAQVSGVIHDVNVEDTGFLGFSNCGVLGLTTFDFGCNAKENKVGWGVDAGVKFNLQNWMGGFWGAGDDIILSGAYTQNAVWYSGIPDGMWGENGQVNGNGQPMYVSDAFFNPLTNTWAKPTAWSVLGILEHHFTPQFYIDLEASVAQLRWSNQGSTCNTFVVTPSLLGCGGLINPFLPFGSFAAGALSPSATSWIVGADIGWNPVTNLNFDLELMYQDTNQQRPNGFVGTINSNGVFLPGDWKGNSNGFAGRFRVTRYF
jgi:hypothetical protein